MCLYIDLSFHRPKNNIIHSAIASRDILVWKVLRMVDWTGGNSPHYDHGWDFGIKYTELGLKKSIKLDLDSDYEDEIHHGLHAVLSRNACRNIARHVSIVDKRYLPAIIPKKSRLWFGTGRDIVANNMIVYPNLAVVEANHGKIAPKVPKSQLVNGHMR